MKFSNIIIFRTRNMSGDTYRIMGGWSIRVSCVELTYFTSLQTFNPFVPNAPFLYPLKRSGCIGKDWVKLSVRVYTLKNMSFAKEETC